MGVQGLGATDKVKGTQGRASLLQLFDCVELPRLQCRHQRTRFGQIRLRWRGWIRWFDGAGDLTGAGGFAGERVLIGVGCACGTKSASLEAMATTGGSRPACKASITSTVSSTSVVPLPWLART